MNNQKLIDDLAELLNLKSEEINMDLNLNSNSYWDSLAVISLIGAIDTYYKVAVSGDELLKAVTIADIFKIINKKIAEKK